MNRGVSFLVIGGAVVLIVVGLIFLCAATRDAGRLPLALILLVIGGGLAFWGGASLRRAVDLDPENLSDRLTRLARQRGGEVTLSQAVSALRAPDEAVEEALDLLKERGQAYPEYREDREVFVFPGFKAGKMVRRCESCGTEYSVKEAVYVCTQCGGKVELVRL
jgi:predicted RNA-binding Zn-ribbon protein involved in translation (DUF1610 family)